MIYYQTLYPESLQGELLDRFLAAGWYRIGQSCITTDLILQEGRPIPVFWLRINLSQYRPSRSARRILSRNAGMRCAVVPFEIGEEIEMLYSIYRASIEHQITPTARDYLLQGLPVNPYDTRLIEVRDGSRLIAAGYFDVGEKCSTGILHIFHPEYARQSPGKLIFLREIEWSMARGDEYYYPGYICTETDKFNYKLFADPDATEVFIRPLKRWVPFNKVAHKLPRWGSMITEAAASLAVVRA